MSRSLLKPSRNTRHADERAATVHGVEGRFMPRILDTANNLFSSQTFIASRPFNEPGYKKGSRITVEVRFDDNCRNGHQSFAITGHVQEPGARDWSTGGCIHEEIAKYFPEFAGLIRWHLMDTDSPMHYVANAMYHASNRANGYAAGEPCAWDTKVQFGEFPITFKLGKHFRAFLFGALEFNRTALKTNPAYVDFKPVAVEHEKKAGDTYDFAPKYTFDGFACKWHECPFDTLAEAEEFAAAIHKYPLREIKIVTAYSKGKERDLDAARRAACWPDATDAQLCAEPEELKAALLARLPALVADFRADMENFGFEWREMETVYNVSVRSIDGMRRHTERLTVRGRQNVEEEAARFAASYGAVVEQIEPAE